jgi:hypothetical protein
MKTQFLALLVFSILLSCRSGPGSPDPGSDSIIFQSGDKELFDQLMALHRAEKEAATSALMVEVGRFFLETPYVAHTLETGNDEQLVVNLREMDCTTFAEYCLALSRTIQSDNQTFGQFAAELQFIRYRNGRMEGYPSRLHYFCDWIHNNAQKKLVEDLSQDLAQTPFPKPINFMSTHPESYRQLKESAPLVDLIAAQEKLISARRMFHIPENRIAELESKLMDGDIAGITTEIEGIAIQHVVILVRQEGRIHMMHASSKAEKVVISDISLEEYLLNSKSASGIMLARPL